jgi:hypothetical protein
MGDGVVGRRLSFGRQLDVSGSMQRQHESPADHVAGLAVGLNPVPGLAHFDREPPSAVARVLRNQLSQESGVGLSDLTTPKTQQHIGHAPQFKERGVER